MSRASPALAILAQPAGGDHAMQMIVIEQRLTPGVQHRRQADLRLERAPAKLQQRRARRVKEQLVERAAVLPDERVERMRQRKDHMKVGHRQQTLRSAFSATHRPGPLAAAGSAGCGSCAATKCSAPQSVQR